MPNCPVLTPSFKDLVQARMYLEDCVGRNLYDQSILVDQPEVTAARELWLAQGGRLSIPFCGSLAKTLLPGGTTQNPYVQTHSGIRAQRAHEHHQ